MKNAGRLVCAVTGASGYVGSTIASALSSTADVLRLVRHPISSQDVLWSFASESELAASLREGHVDVLIHAAWDMNASSMKELEVSCVQGSERLFAAAQEAGVKRIVFISTISAFDGCRSAYGRAKLEVEKMARARGAVVLRLGLVYGDKQGGVFGHLRQQVHKFSSVPVINNGREPQYLLDEQTLSETTRRAAYGCFDHLQGEPLTIAHPRPWPFRELVQRIAEREHRSIRILPVPWMLLYGALRCGELLGFRLPFRSDSVLSFVRYNRAPDFSLMERLGISPSTFS